MQFRVLGTIEVGNSGDRLDIGGLRQRRLLCSLLVARGSTVSVDRLVEEVWDDHDRPTQPEAAVRTCVTRLRRALEEGAGVVVTRSPGYALEAGNHTVDAISFEELIGSALATDVSLPTETRLREALGLWRGSAFEEFEDLEWCRPEAERLTALRLVGVEMLNRVRLESGEALELVPELERDCAAHPLHEPLRIMLIEALWRAGRASDALRAAHFYRRYLAEETGLEPSLEFGRLETSVLSGEGQREREPSAMTDDVGGRLGNLPHNPSSFIGREGELIVLAGLLAEHRVVTLLGTGGVGKTRTAIEASAGLSESFEHGAWLVEMAPIPTGQSVSDPIAAALRVLLPAANSFDEVIDGLREQRALILLDNCEHVISSAANAVRRIVGNCPNCVVLCTSRQPLDIAEEVVFDLDPLPSGESGGQRSDAAQLLVERSGESRLPFDDPINSDEIEAVAARLDGVPLAIELAAARLRTMTLQELHRELDNQLTFLERRDGGEGHRHRSLHAAIDWSYQLLSEDDRQLLRGLSVFAASFTESDAVAVVELEQGASDGIRRLVEHSMLQRSVTDEHSTFALLDSIRQFADDELPDDRRTKLSRRHAEHYLSMTQTALSEPQSSRLRTRLDPLLVELRTALERNLDDRALWARLHRVLLDASQRCGRHDLERGASHSALKIAEAALENDDIDIELLEIGARAGWLLAEYDTAIGYAERWLSAARNGSNPEFEVDPLWLVARLNYERRNLDEMRRAIDEFELLAKTLGSDAARAKAHVSLAHLCMLDEREDLGLEAAQSAIGYAEVAGDDQLLARALVDKGTMILGRDPEAGQALVEEGVRLADRTGDRLLVSRGLWNIADAMVDPTKLRSMIGRVEAAAIASGYQAMMLNGSPWLRTIEAVANADWTAAQHQLTETTGPYFAIETTALRCHLALESGDDDAAHRHVTALGASRGDNTRANITYLLVALRLAGFRRDLVHADDLAAQMPAWIDQRILSYLNLAWTLEELDWSGAGHLLLSSTADAMSDVDTFQSRYLRAWSTEGRDVIAAEAAYHSALDTAKRDNNSNYAASAHTALGRLASVGGDHESAKRHLNTALAQLEKWPGRRRSYVQELLEQTQNHLL